LSGTHAKAIAVVVVTHESSGDLPALTAALVPQLQDGDEVVVVDNASKDSTADVARSLDGPVRVLETGRNLGFAGGCHAGAHATVAPLLLFLNPDCRPEPGCLERLRHAADLHRDWGAWQAAVLLEDGTVNSSGGVVHYLGIGWAGDCERPLSLLPADDRNVAFPSGAAMVVRRELWSELRGLDVDYFMYGEDLDLGLRIWLAGHRVGMVPAARVIHGYEFEKGPSKWFWLERNRWRTVLSVYPAGLLALVAPALLASEAGLVLIAARDGWLGPKLRAQLAVLAGLPRTLARRRSVQATRRVGSREFAAHLTSSLESPYLAGAASGPLNAPQAFYWRLVSWILELPAR